MFAIANRFQGRVKLALLQLPLRQGAQVKITSGGDPRSRVT
jgi:hypothetical protein